MSSGKISDYVKAELAVKPQDIGTADVTSAYRSMVGFDKARAILVTADLADTKIATVQLMQAKTSGGGSAKTLGSAVNFVASGTQQANAQVEVQGEEFDTANGFSYIAVKVGTDVNGTVGCAILELSSASYRPIP